MHLDRVAGDLLAPAVEPLLELAARERQARAVEQRFQQRELARRDRDRPAAVRDLAGGGIERERAVRDLRLGAAGVAAEHGADARRELLQAEGLDQVVVGAEIEALHPVGDRVARGEDEHRDAVLAPAQAVEDLEPVLAGQAEVEEHEVVGLGRERGLRSGAVLHPVGRVAFLPQPLAQAFPDHCVVFHEKQPHVGHPRSIGT